METIINYYDLGLYQGREIKMFIDICNSNNWDYRIYGFEAHPEFSEKIKNLYSTNGKVEIFNKAISNKYKLEKLYLASPNAGEGNSIFSTKSNVDTSFIEVEGIPFSDFLNSQTNFKNNFNILRFNIEGAEWHLMQDLINNQLNQYFQIYCGSTPDMHKVGELKQHIPTYNNLLLNNNIHTYRFTFWKPELNDNLEELIKNKLATWKK